MLAKQEWASPETSREASARSSTCPRAVSTAPIEVLPPRVKVASFMDSYSSRMATARVQPADAPLIFTGKQATLKPAAGSFSRLCSFSMWQ